MPDAAPAASASVYVYYKLADADAAQARAAARALLATGRPYCARARLLRRPDSRDGLQTWMEAYEGVADPAGLMRALEAALPASGLAPWLRGPRHAESFVELDPPCA